MSKQYWFRFWSDKAKSPTFHGRANWGSFDSHLARLNDLIQTVVFRKSGVLDVGCGSGFFEKYLGNKDILGVDFSREQLKAAKKLTNNDYVCCDAEYLPFKSDCFDLVFSIGVLQNCGVPANRVIKELIRVSNNQVYLSTLISDPAKDVHVKVFEPSELEGICKGLGLNVKKIKGIFTSKGPQYHDYCIYGAKK